jgi:hypothetical protein
VPIPWKQSVDPVDRMVGDAGDDIAQLSLGIEVIEVRGLVSLPGLRNAG